MALRKDLLIIGGINNGKQRQKECEEVQAEKGEEGKEEIGN